MPSFHIILFEDEENDLRRSPCFSQNGPPPSRQHLAQLPQPRIYQAVLSFLRLPRALLILRGHPSILLKLSLDQRYLDNHPQQPHLPRSLVPEGGIRFRPPDAPDGDREQSAKVSIDGREPGKCNQVQCGISVCASQPTQIIAKKNTTRGRIPYSSSPSIS